MDYSKSAVGLTNPEELKVKLTELASKQIALMNQQILREENRNQLDRLQDKIYASLSPELVEQIALMNQQILREENRNQLDRLQDKIYASLPPELVEEVTKLNGEKDKLILGAEDIEADILLITQEIKTYCEKNDASYQDLTQGWWAIKQKKETVTYLPDKVKANLPKEVAAMVIVEAVDSDKMAGMIKGKFVTAEDARKCANIENKYNYIVKVEPPAKV